MSNRITRSQAETSGANAPDVAFSAIVSALAALGLVAMISAAAAQQMPDGANVAGLAAAQSSPSQSGRTVQRKAPSEIIDMRALLNDPTIRDFRGLSENSWDFTDPNGIPGFGPMPTPSEGATGR
jgi:hypothetical protein